MEESRKQWERVKRMSRSASISALHHAAVFITDEGTIRVNTRREHTVVKAGDTTTADHLTGIRLANGLVSLNATEMS